MAEAKRAGGLYYVNSVAVDANGEPVKGAPKQPADTPPEEIARVAATKDPVQRLADTLDRTFGGGAHAASMAAMRGPAVVSSSEEETDSEEQEGLPTLADLPDRLASMDDADEIKKMRRSDKRVGAKEHYKQRLAELSGE